MTTIIAIVYYLFLVSIVVQLCYWALIFNVLSKQETKTNVRNQDPFVSIIAVYKDPKAIFSALLDSLGRQEYNSKEVILMDDYSTQTQKIPKEPYFRYLKPSQDVPGKKLALTESINQANGEYILVTDADCLPTSNKWVSTMVAQVKENIQIVLGYSPYQKQEGRLNTFIRYEAWLTGVQYLSYALCGMPYMGVGRNMMYEKALFLQSSPYTKHPDLLSGDDDLFINTAATKTNTSVCLDPDSFVFSKPKQTWQAYFQQKQRHITTSTTYQTKHKFLLGLYSASQIMVLFSGITLLFTSMAGYAILAFMLYMMIKWNIAIRLLRVLGEDDLIKVFPILDLTYTVFIVMLAPFLIFKSQKW